MYICITKRFEYKPLNRRHCLVGSELGFCVASRYAFSFKVLFLAHGFESFLSHLLTKSCPPLLSWGQYTVRCHSIPWSIDHLTAKISETQYDMEWKSWIGCILRTGTPTLSQTPTQSVVLLRVPISVKYVEIIDKPRKKPFSYYQKHTS